MNEIGICGLLRKKEHPKLTEQQKWKREGSGQAPPKLNDFDPQDGSDVTWAGGDVDREYEIEAAVYSTVYDMQNEHSHTKTAGEGLPAHQRE